MSFKVIIPARYASSRLSGKPLLEIGDKTLIQHVYESARASNAEQVIVATDDERIVECVKGFDGKVMMTSTEHESGTDRLAELVTELALADDELIVNVQGDEFGLSEKLINQLAVALQNHEGEVMATLCERISDADELSNPNVVKVIADKNNRAIYFSRSPIPWQDSRSKMPVYRHIGLYAYRAGFLREYAALPVCSLEQSERLEQLRALYYGYGIYIEEACEACGLGIDTADDLEKARAQRLR